MLQTTDLPVVSLRLPTQSASRRRFGGWMIVGLFSIILVVLSVIIWHQTGKTALMKGIEERGGIVHREPTPLQELISDAISSLAKPKPRGKSGAVVRLSILTPTPEEIEFLRTSPSINNLTLKNGRVTQSLLEAFHELPNLKELMLLDFNLTNEELKQIVEAFPQPAELTYLGLRNTKLDDAGLVSLTRCKNLSTIYIDGSNIDGSGLSSLSALPLTAISINHSRIKDRNVEEVVDPWRGSLKSIYLNYNPITDAGLKSLQGLNLRLIPGISGTEVTAPGLKELLDGQQIGIVILADLPWSISDLKELPLDPNLSFLDLSGWKIKK